MNVPLSLEARQARLLGLRGLLDGGGVQFYPNSPPDKIEDAPGQPLLGTVDLSDPAGSIGEVGDLALLAITVPLTGLVVTGGVAGWVRVVKPGGAGVTDLLVGLASGDYSETPAPPVLLSEVQLYPGGEINVVSFAFVE